MLPASSHATQLPADQQAVLASLQERCLASADAAVQHRVLQQLRVASQHLQALASALLLQQQLTGLDPRTPEAKQQAALAAGFAPDDLEQQAHDEDVDTDRAPLTPEAERLLQAAFALADVLDGSQVSGLAFLARCSEQQLRNHFSRLRTTVRSVVQRAQKRAHGSTSSTAKAGVGAAVNPASSGVQYPPPPLTSTPGAPTPHAAPQQQAGTGAPEQLQGFALALQQQQEAALQRTHQLLDPAGLITMSSAGSFVAAMQQTASYTARRRQLAALRATGVSTLTRLCTSKFLDILQAWLQEGLAEQQLSFVRQVLHTLQHVPINTALLHSSTLLQTVRDMAKRGPVAASAAQVVRKWGQQQEQSTWDGLQPLLLGVHPGGSGAAGKAPGARQQAEGGLLGMRPLGGPSLAAQRSLSAAVKRKVQEMKAGGAAQPATAAATAVAGGGGGGTVGTGAPRAPSSSAQQQQQQQPSSLQRQASAVGGATAGAGVPPGSSGTSSSSTAAAAAAAGFKRPSKVARTLSGAGQPSAAAQRAALVQRQLSGAAAAGASGGATPSALAAAGSTGGGAGAAAGPVRVSKPADLTPGQRLYRMQVRPVDQQLLQRMAAPGSAATASQLAQGLMSYNRSLQLWLAARCRRVGAEARSAAQLALQRQQQRQQQQAVAGYGMAAAAAPPAAAAAEAGVAVGVQGGPTEPWVEPPKAVWSTELDGQVASGQESQDAANHQLATATASSAYGTLPAGEDSPGEPSEDAGITDIAPEPGAGAPAAGDEAGGGAAAGASGQAAVVPWQPSDGQTAATAACRVWSAGIRVPHCYQLPLPSAQEVARYEAEQQAAKAPAAQPAGMVGAPAAGQLVHPQYATAPQYGLPAQPVQQQPAPGMVVQMLPGQVVQPGGYAVAQHHQPMQQVMQVVYPPGYVAHPAGYMPYVQQYPPPGYQ